AQQGAPGLSPVGVTTTLANWGMRRTRTTAPQYAMFRRSRVRLVWRRVSAMSVPGILSGRCGAGATTTPVNLETERRSLGLSLALCPDSLGSPGSPPADITPALVWCPA